MTIRIHAGLGGMLLASTVVACAPAGAVGAAGDEGAETVTDSAVNGDLLTAGTRVRVEAPVSGDIAAAGGNVDISGPVDGYVMSAGRHVSLGGRIGNDLWAAGETVDLAGTVANNARIAGRTVHLHAGAAIQNDARLAGDRVIIEGRVDHDLRVAARAASLGGEVGGSVIASAREVTLEPGAVIRGDLIVRSPKEPSISPQAQVLGSVRHEPTEERGWAAWPLMWAIGFVMVLLLGAAAMTVTPAWPSQVSSILGARLGTSALFGVLLVVLVPIAAVLLLATIVGIPIGIVLLAAYAVAVVLSAVFVSYRVGGVILDMSNRQEASRWLRITLGALVVSLAISLPIVGWVAALTVVVLGVGAVALDVSTPRSRRFAGPGVL